MLTATADYNQNVGTAASGGAGPGVVRLGVVPSGVSGLYADLSAATSATINQLRQSFQIQRLLERDARGGTRYTELLRAHFGVTPQDYRLQRPEYIGGGSTYVNVNPIAQTSATSISAVLLRLVTWLQWVLRWLVDMVLRIMLRNMDTLLD